MSATAFPTRREAGIGSAAFQVLDAGHAAPDMPINGPSHAARME